MGFTGSQFSRPYVRCLQQTRQAVALLAGLAPAVGNCWERFAELQAYHSAVPFLLRRAACGIVRDSFGGGAERSRRSFWRGTIHRRRRSANVLHGEASGPSGKEAEGLRRSAFDRSSLWLEVPQKWRPR